MTDTLKQTNKDPLADPRVTKNEDGSYTVKLNTPAQVVVGDAPMTSVTLKRVNGRGMTAMYDAEGKGSQLEALTLASAKMTGPLADAFMEAVDGNDWTLLVGVAATFLGNGQTTGQ